MAEHSDFANRPAFYLPICRKTHANTLYDGIQLSETLVCKSAENTIWVIPIKQTRDVFLLWWKTKRWFLKIIEEADIWKDVLGTVSDKFWSNSNRIINKWSFFYKVACESDGKPY